VRRFARVDVNPSCGRDEQTHQHRIPRTDLVDDTWQEQRERVQRHVRARVQEHAQPCPRRNDRLPDVACVQALACCRELVVALQPAYNLRALRLTEELGGIWEVLHNPEAEDAGDDGREAFEDEDPGPDVEVSRRACGQGEAVFLPRSLASDVMHVRDRGGEEAAECSRDRRSREEDGGTDTKLRALVPAAQIVVDSVKRSARNRGDLRPYSPRKQASLEKPEKKACSEKTSIVVNEALSGHGNPP
jgi:hypothetical protein